MTAQIPGDLALVIGPDDSSRAAPGVSAARSSVARTLHQSSRHHPNAMRILWLGHFLPYPPKGGALQRSHHLLRQVAARHEVHLVSLSQRAILKGPEAVGEAVRELRSVARSVSWFPIPSDRARWRWWGLVAMTYLRSAPYDVTWLASPAMACFLDTLAGQLTFDLIHVDTIGLWPYVEPFDGTPIVLNHHNVESQMMARRADREARPMQRLYFNREAAKLRRLELTACPKASVNLVVSPLDAERLEQAVPGCRVLSVANGVDSGYFRPAQLGAAEPGSLVFVGGMNWYPNSDAALYFVREIWPLLLQTNPNRSVTFLGQDPPAELAGNGDPRVRAPGFVDDVRPYVDRAEVYICPIRDGGGTRLKVLDALAMAKPLVATSVAVEGIAVVDGEHYLRAENPGDFAAMIDRLAADPALRQRLGANGRRLVERSYSWSAIGQTLEKAYVTAIDRRPDARPRSPALTRS